MQKKSGCTESLLLSTDTYHL